MGFGFGIGDFLAVGQLAWKVYKSCTLSSFLAYAELTRQSGKGAGGAFEEVSHEGMSSAMPVLIVYVLIAKTVIALHTAIKELEDEVENPDSILNRTDHTGASKLSELELLVKNCKGALQQLNKLLIKYNSLGTSSRRTFDVLRFGAENLSEIREKLMTHTSSLALFLTTLGTGSLGRVERKLDELIVDVRAGSREKSVFSVVDEEESETQWQELKGEFVEEGFTKVELEGQKHFIVVRLKHLIEKGELEEQSLLEKAGLSRLLDTSTDVSITRPKIPPLAKLPNPSASPRPSAKRPPCQPSFENGGDDEDRIATGWGGNGTNWAVEQHPITGRGPTRENDIDSWKPDRMHDNSDETFLAPTDSVSNVGPNVPDPETDMGETSYSVLVSQGDTACSRR
jgi:hypothetical protein